MSSAIHTHLDNLRKEVLKNPATKKYANLIEEKTKIPIELSILGVIGVLAAFLFIGIGANIITNIVGFIYPFYATLKSIEADNREENQEWLIYWVVFALFCIVDNFIHYVLYWLPIFYPIKVTFLLWCMIPKFKGAKTVYENLIKPIFLKHESNIDAALNSVNNSQK
jgi:receptor expression-enhancing protein 5/6